jgi:hypothetical protein
MLGAARRARRGAHVVRTCGLGEFPELAQMYDDTSIDTDLRHGTPIGYKYGLVRLDERFVWITGVSENARMATQTFGTYVNEVSAAVPQHTSEYLTRVAQALDRRFLREPLPGDAYRQARLQASAYQAPGRRGVAMTLLLQQIRGNSEGRARDGRRISLCSPSYSLRMRKAVHFWEILQVKLGWLQRSLSSQGNIIYTTGLVSK